MDFWFFILKKKEVVILDKKTTNEINQQFNEAGIEEKSIGQRQTFDELYKGKSYVVKERTDYYRLKYIPTVSSSGTNKKFRSGDRVKNQQGELLTVLVQLGNLVIVKEEDTNYHPNDLTMIEHTVDRFQV